MPAAPAFRTAMHRQRGSILVPAALAIVLGLLLLWGAQLGYAFYLKRELQKTADLAALSAAQVLDRGFEADCTAAQTAAQAAIEANMSGVTADPPACQRWDPADPALAPRYLRARQDDERYNAIRVVLSIGAPSLFPFTAGTTLHAEAVAARPGEPLAAFSVGTRLAKVVPGAILINLLKKVGLDLDGTKVAGYDAALATVKITPAGLLKAMKIDVPADISVGDLNRLLAAHVSGLDGLLDAVVQAAGHDELLAANVGLLHAIEAVLHTSDPLNVQLGSDQDGRASSLFAKISAPDSASALGVQLNALDVLATAIGVGTGGHAVQLDGGISLPAGLLSVPVRLSLIEPPSIAIGGVGTQAYTGQFRLFLPIKISTAQLPLVGKLINLDVDIPIALDLVSATGTLSKMCQDTDDRGRDLATIDVQSQILKLCVGDIDPDTVFSTSQSCDQGLKPKRLLSLWLGTPPSGVNLLSVKPDPPITTNALPADGFDDLHARDLTDPDDLPVQIPKDANRLEIGTTVTSLVDALLAGLLGHTLDAGQDLPSAERDRLRNELANDIWTSTKDQMAPPCNPSASGKSGYDCRKAIFAASEQSIDTSYDGLSGFLGSTLDDTLNIVGSLASLDVLGLLQGVGNLVTGLLGDLGDMLGDILGNILPTDPCAHSFLGLTYGGTEAGCIAKLASALDTPGGGGSNAAVGLIGFLFHALQPVLDALGHGLAALLSDVVGLQIGQTDVDLMTLDCNGKGVQLVY